MKKILTLLVLLTSFAVSSFAQANGKLLISARLSGAQEVPAVSTGATGVAGFLLNENRDSLFINISVANLSGPITGIHVHEAAKGSNGGVVTNLSTFVSGNFISTVVTGTSLTNQMIANLLSGKYYVNVHTAANPNGEIRGQLEPESDWGFYGMLQGSQEVPPVSTNAEGWAVASLSKNKKTVQIWAVFRNLTGAATAAHLHKAAMGANGGVVADLSSNISGNTIVANIPADAFAEDLASGNIYLNIHTAANANGELRAQLMLSDKINFVAWLNGAQEVPSSMAVGEGVALFRVSPTLDSLWYDVLVDSLTGALGGAHIHEGAMGATGGVLVDLSTGINGNSISGMATGLAAATLNKIMMGNAYINLHTNANMNGEVRGQLMPLARTGYIALINGLQEVPPVTTTAMGSGIVSVDAMKTNAHYMFVVSGLSGAIGGAHFHNGATGANGNVVYDLSPSFGKTATSDSAFGYWTTGFTATNAQQFANGEIYINIHTAANMNGEIRGQVTDRGMYMPISTGIFSPVKNTDISLYPNPVQNTLYISLNNADNTNATIKISDIQGKTIATYQADAIGQNMEIPVQNLDKGIYVITIQTAQAQGVARFIKQ